VDEKYKAFAGVPAAKAFNPVNVRIGVSCNYQPL